MSCSLDEHIRMYDDIVILYYPPYVTFVYYKRKEMLQYSCTT